MKWSENWFWFWNDLLEVLCNEYWICPYCGSNRVAQCWEVLAGRFRNGERFGPYGGMDENFTKWVCADCTADWEGDFDSPLEYMVSWRDWQHKGKIIKLHG